MIVFFALFGLESLGVFAVGGTLLGIVAIVTAIALLLSK